MVSLFDNYLHSKLSAVSKALSIFALYSLLPIKMVSPKSLTLLLFSTLAAASPVKRDPSELISDINNIDLGVKALTASIDAYQGGVLSGTPIVADILAIHLANRKGYLDANLASPFSTEDSDAIVKFTADTVSVDIPASVKLLESKKALFAASGLTSFVETSLQALKSDHDTFSAALESKLAAESLPAGAVAVKVIDDALQEAIDEFSS
jgi:hypothetical protein